MVTVLVVVLVLVVIIVIVTAAAAAAAAAARSGKHAELLIKTMLQSAELRAARRQSPERGGEVVDGATAATTEAVPAASRIVVHVQAR